MKKILTLMMTVGCWGALGAAGRCYYGSIDYAFPVIVFHDVRDICVPGQEAQYLGGTLDEENVYAIQCKIAGINVEYTELQLYRNATLYLNGWRARCEVLVDRERVIVYCTRQRGYYLFHPRAPLSSYITMQFFLGIDGFLPGSQQVRRVSRPLADDERYNSFDFRDLASL